MSILVTGGAGYIGSHLVHALADRQGRNPQPVIVLDNLSTGHAAAVPEGVTLVEGDIGDAGLLDTIIRHRGITEIVHFAAKIVVPESIANPMLYYDNNTAKSRVLIEAALRGGVKRFVFSSTAAVYGNASGAPIDESLPAAPVSPYGRSKLFTEAMLADAAAAHGMAYAILRYFNVAGADPEGRTGQSFPNATHLIKVAVQAALGQRPHLDLYGDDYPTRDGTCIRDFIHVSDLAAAHLDALAHLRRGGESLTLNCGYGRGFTVREVIDMVKQVTGVDFPVHRQPRRPGDPAAIIANPARIRAVLGWTPRFDDLETIVRTALAWEKGLQPGPALQQA